VREVTNVLKPVVAVDAVTPNRGIDAEFLDLPRQGLADAALSAAAAAGANYADLRIHRIAIEIIQLRDGKRETAVLSRELGLAVRVIVAGTWGFASHAELSSLLAEKVEAPSATPGPMGLVIEPSNLWLVTHRSIGHATEYDRRIGYESTYTGS
jgi:predicted Zn-dependent protease